MPLTPDVGAVIGQPQAEIAGRAVLESGGTAVDAAVTAALTAAVCALPSCGMGGYGGAMVIALATGKVTAIDFNTEAPSHPPARPHRHGWLAAGTPGTLAGLDLALHRYGTRRFRECLAPAIRFASEGFPLSQPLAAAIASSAERLRADPGSANLYLPGGTPPAPSALFRNSNLARFLERLARDNSAESLYRGPDARLLAQAFARGGGALTEKDLNAYEAREAAPVHVRLGPYMIHTAGLTAGGATSLQALAAVHALAGSLDESRLPHARLESLRLAWHDRLTRFGDPGFVRVPLERLLSEEHASESARKVLAAVEAGKPLELAPVSTNARGTIHLSAADRHGNLVALTLTHGDGFGACVTAEELGLTLGHGMSRFEDLAGHPNAIAGRKRPLHNMCPTVVTRGRKPIAALGATGGRRIPNAIFDVLAAWLTGGVALERAVAAPRMNTTGSMDLVLTPGWPSGAAERFGAIGYQVRTGGAARLNAVAIEPRITTAAG